jgi:hypothetical protein
LDTVSPSGSITSRRIKPPTCGGFFIDMVQISPSMIVNQINVERVTYLTLESQRSKLGRHYTAPIEG